jgi:tight adherence protein B
MQPQFFAVAVFGATLLVVAILIGINHKAAESRRVLLRRRITRSRHARVALNESWVFEREVKVGRLGAWVATEIARSGLDLKPIQVVFASIGLACLSLLSGMFLGMVSALMLAVVLASAPFAMLRAASAATEQEMLEQLPGAIDTLISDLRAGGTFERALRRTSVEVAAPLGTQFSFVSQRMLVGIEQGAALRALSQRFPKFFELRQLIGIIMLQQRTGGDLVKVLGNQRDALQDSISLRGRMKAASSEARTSVKVLMALPILSIVGTHLVSPGYHDPLLAIGTGRAVFIGAGLWMFIGLFLMANLIKRSR